MLTATHKRNAIDTDINMLRWNASSCCSILDDLDFLIDDLLLECLFTLTVGLLFYTETHMSFRFYMRE